MKSIFHFATLVALSPSLYAIPLSQSPIQNVTVYLNGAMIERHIPVMAGQSSISLDGMPANFNLQEMQVSANNNIIIGNVTGNDSQDTTTFGQKSQALQKRVDQLQHDLDLLDIDIEAAQLQLTYIESMSATVNQSTLIRQQAKEAYRIISQAEQKKIKVAEELNNEQRNLQQQGNGQFATRQLNIQVQAPTSGIVTLRYAVKNATWRPYYQASLDSSKGQVSIERMAKVKQQTGEDWQNIPITLSTTMAKGQSGQLIPTAWQINLIDPSNSSWANRETFIGLEGNYGKIRSSTLQGAPKKQDEIGVNTIELPYAINYQSKGKMSISSSSEETIMPLENRAYPATLAARAVPRLQKFAVIEASLPKLDGIWLDGEMKLYRDGSYVGKTTFNNDSTLGTALAFGEDRRISVTVDSKTVPSKTSGSRSTKTIAEQYRIRNNHPTAIELTVLEAIPTSIDKDIKIQPHFSPQPNLTTWRTIPNIYQWRTKLDPKQSFDLDLKYEFNYSNEKTISGLPR